MYLFGFLYEKNIISRKDIFFLPILTDFFYSEKQIQV